jgi:hypothetical protein
MWRVARSHKRLLLIATSIVVVSGAVTSIALANIKPEKNDVLQLGSTNLKLEFGEGVVIECQNFAVHGSIEHATTKANLELPGFYNSGGTECRGTGGAGVRFTPKGTWSLIDNGATKGSIQMSRGALVFEEGSCLYTLAPTGVANLEGVWHNGANSTEEPSSLELKEAPVEIAGTGTGCATTSTIKVTGTVLVKDQTEPTAAVVFS